MINARRLAGWVAAGVIASVIAAGGALAAPVAPNPAGPAVAAEGRQHPAGEVLRQIQQARPKLTEAQWQQWQAAAEQILTVAVKEGKLTSEQAESIRLKLAARKAGIGPDGWQDGDGHRHGGKPGHAGRDRGPQARQERLARLKSRLEQAVRDGKLTREQADRILKQMTERMQQREQNQMP